MIFKWSSHYNVFPLILPVAVSTADWDTLSFSAGLVISAKPAPTKPCRGEEIRHTRYGFSLYLLHVNGSNKTMITQWWRVMSFMSVPMVPVLSVGMHSDTQTGESNQQPSDNKMLALPLIHSHPIFFFTLISYTYICLFVNCWLFFFLQARKKFYKEASSIADWSSHHAQM